MHPGDTFRKLRVHKNYKLAFTAKDIVSISQLSKFERGESEITISKVFLLLERMNVSFEEFMFIHNEFQSPHFESMIKKLKSFYIQKDFEKLHRLAQDEQLKFENTGQLTYKLNSIMIKAVFSDLTNETVEEEEIKILTDYLWRVEIWGEYELILFGNSMHVLNIDSVITLSSETMKKSMFFRKMLAYRKDLYGLYFNTIRTCLNCGKIKEAESFLIYLKNEEIHETFIFEKIILRFYEGLMKMHTSYEVGLKIANKAIHLLREVDAKNYAVSYEEFLFKYKEKLTSP